MILRRILLHITFWVLGGAFLVAFLNERSENIVSTVFFTALLVPVACGTSYVFNYYLFPKYLFASRYFKLIFYGLFVVTLSVYCQTMIVVGTFILSANYEFENMIPGTTNVVNLAVAMYFLIFLSALIYLMKRWSNPSERLVESEPEYLVIKVNRTSMRIDPREILFVESLDNYIKIHRPEDTLLVKDRISRLEHELPEAFMRTHRSFLVNTHKIEAFTKEAVKINTNPIPISRTYKQRVLKRLNNA